MAGIIGVYDETYSVSEIRSIRDIKKIFPDGYEAKNNWFFLSTQGAHGKHDTLDEIEDLMHSKDIKKYWITCLIVQPRLCNLYYGYVQVNLKDIPFLRQLVKNTLEVIPKTQRGNT